ncbi:MAG: HD domain-containing phosphohydrolase [Motiliproteus sp.]
MPNDLNGATALSSPNLHVEGIVAARAIALDAREYETGLHSKRVACHTLVLARHITDDPTEPMSVYYGLLLHDIGKIAIPDRILLKSAPLTAQERKEMETHSQRGYEILTPVPQLKAAADIVLSHEESLHGKGYPNRLTSDRIPIGARLLAVIDTLDAMTSDRVYRKTLSFDKARAEIVSLSGKQLDPSVVDVFLVEEGVLRKMVALKCSRPDLGNLV